jgi:hypothetical protein
MTEPDERAHPNEPAEGGDPSDTQRSATRTPHSEDPAEGADAEEADAGESGPA